MPDHICRRDREVESSPMYIKGLLERVKPFGIFITGKQPRPREGVDFDQQCINGNKTIKAINPTIKADVSVTL